MINRDSISAIYLTKNQLYHKQMTHINVRFHFIREILEEGDLVLEKIHTKENPTDMLIKVISGAKFNHCKNLLHIFPIA